MSVAVQDAVDYLQGRRDRPVPSEVVSALAVAEKQSKREKQRYSYEQLLGRWQLGFVSGTRKASPSRPGAKPTQQLGKGRFLPRWLEISITYGPQAQLLSPKLLDVEEGNADSSDMRSPDMKPSDVKASDSALSETDALGAVVNRVALGGVSLQLSGPTRYWPKTNTLGFDFVYLKGGIGPLTLYDAPVRGGIAQAKAFADLPLKEQAFFTFFAVEQDYIAARGKGGGLALWTRATSVQN